MATRKSAKATDTTPIMGVDTGSGLLMAFDHEVERLMDEKGWCSSGRTYAYDQSGVPRPSERTSSPMDAVIMAANYFQLSPEGEAAVAAARKEHDSKLGKYRAGVRKAAIFGMEQGRLTLAEVNGILGRLNCGRLRAAKVHNGYISAQVDWRSDRQLTSEETTAIRDAVRTAFEAALKASMPEGIGVTVKTRADQFTSHSDRTANSTYVEDTTPEEAPAETAEAVPGGGNL